MEPYLHSLGREDVNLLTSAIVMNPDASSSKASAMACILLIVIHSSAHSSSSAMRGIFSSPCVLRFLSSTCWR